MIKMSGKSILQGILLTMALLCALFAGLIIPADAAEVPGTGDITETMTVASGDTCNIGNGDILSVKSGGTLAVEAGGTLSVEAGGTLSVEAGAMALVKPDAAYTNGDTVSGTVLNFSETTGNWNTDYDTSLYSSNAGNWTISDAADLAAFMMKVNDGADFSGDTVTLSADITLCAHSWTPIGTPALNFQGTFNGAGHTISGLYFDDSTKDNVGLFAYMGGGTIENLAVVKSYLHGGNDVGGIVGYAYGCTVCNCASNAAVFGANNVGGIAGVLNAPSNSSIGVYNCYASGMVSGSGAAGGIAGGELTSSGNVTFDVRYCYYLSDCCTDFAVGDGTVPEDCYSFSGSGTDWTLTNAEMFGMTDSGGNPVDIAAGSSLLDALNAYVADSSLYIWTSGAEMPTLGEKWWQVDITLDANGGDSGGSATVRIRNQTELITEPQYAGFAVYGYYDAADGGSMVMDSSGVLQPNSKYTDSGASWTQKSGTVTLYAVYDGSTSADIDLSKGTFMVESDGTYRSGGVRFHKTGMSFHLMQSDSADTATTNTIIVNAGCTLTLSGVNISASGAPAMRVSSGLTVNIILADGSVNTLRSAGRGYAGIDAAGGTVNISGSGALSVFGGQGNTSGDRFNPVGYGGYPGIQAASTNISGGTVSVTGGQGGNGGYFAASGFNGGDGGTGIVGGTATSISGGIVHICGGQGGPGGSAPNPQYNGSNGNGGAGISGTVDISGGTDTITGGTGRSSGSSIISASSITITGGSISVGSMNVRPTNGSNNVYRTTVTLYGADSAKAALAGYGGTDMYTDSNGVLYLWLPEDTSVPCVTGNTADQYQYYYTAIVTKSDDSAAGTLYATGYTATVSFKLDGEGYFSDSRSVLLYNAGGTYCKTMTTADGYTFTVSVPVVDSASTYTIFVNYARTNAVVTASAPSKTFNYYTVTYDYAFNGGTSAEKKVIYPEDGTVMTAFPSLTGEKSGWTGVGWNTDSSATTGISSYTANKTETLYAIYSKELTANFYSGVNIADCETVTHTIYNRSTEYAFSAPEVAAETAANDDGRYLAIDNWVLDGWRTDDVADAGSATGLTVSVDEGSGDFFAVYRLSLTGTFYSGINKERSDSDTVTKFYNTRMPSLPEEIVTVTPPDSHAEVSPGGWTFLGWRNDTKADAAQDDPMTISANTDFYAVYSRTITLSYEGNGAVSGSTGQSSGVQYYTSYNMVSPAGLPAAPCSYSRTGFIFDKWAFASLDGTQYAQGSIVPIPYDADAAQTLYAIWQIDENSAGFENQSYSGTYDGSEHTVTVTAPAGITVKYYNASTLAYDLDSAPMFKGSGQYTVSWKMTGSGITARVGSSTVAISPVSLDIPDESFPYSGTATITVPDFSGGGVLDGESVTLTYTPYTKTAGEYAYASKSAEGKYTLALSDENYVVGTAGKLTITAVALDIPGDTAGSTRHSVTYSGAEFYSRSYSTGVNGETITLTYRPSSPHVGDYAYSAEAGDDHYTLTLSDSTDYTVASAGSLTIEQVALDVPAQAKVYDGAADYVVKNYATGVNGEAITLSYHPFSPHAAVYAYSTEAGESKYTLTLSDSDYRVSSAGTLTVTQATPVIKLGNTAQCLFGNGKSTAVTALLTPSSGEVAATVQYFVEGTGWTNTVPQLAGTYSVRAYVAAGNADLLPTNVGTGLKAVDYDVSEPSTHDAGVTYGNLTITQPSGSSSTETKTTGYFTDAQIDSAIRSAASGRKVILTTSDSGMGLTSAQVQKIASSGYAVILETVNGDVSFTGTGFKSLADKIGSEMLNVAVTHENAGKSYPDALSAMQVALSIGGTDVHSGFGAITITVPLGAAHAGQTFSVLHLKSDGSREVLTGTADAAGDLSFDTSSLSVFVLFGKGALPVKDLFTDLTQDWYLDGIQYVYDNDLFKGTGNDTFSPGKTMSRAMMVTVLYRLAGKPAVDKESAFVDVADKTEYCYDAVVWAAQNGIVGGFGNGRFGPDEPVTRQQLVAVLFRYNQKFGNVTQTGSPMDMSQFTDSGSVAVWADAAMQWAFENGIISGTSETTLSPEGNSSRAQVAVILQRYCKAAW